MAEIDPVILELRADLDKYRSDIRRMTSEVTTRLGVQEASVKSLENQFKRSSDSIGNTARGLAASFAALFSGREVVGMIDSFTRLQNSLKVAGLEGRELESVQASLLDLSKQYGVGIEGLANLYGKATDAGRSFGASEAQVLQLTEATSQALKITGTNAAQASGAILGLSQALASGTVRAEEYNQINEGGLRPLLQAAAGAERFGGDINKLRAAMLDGKVSSQEFFAGIIAGSAELEGKASKATLTLSGAYEALTSSMTVYVGQAAQANGVTNALAGGLQTLAENLDSLVTVLAVIATFIAGRYVGALAGAAGAALATARANVILSASAVGAGTSMQVMAVRATLAGRAALAAFGGPVGLAVTALTIGLGAMAYASRDTAASLDELKSAAATSQSTLEDARNQAKRAGVDIDNLKTSTDNAKGSFAGFNAILWKSVDAMIAASKSAKNLALAKLGLSDAEARQVITERGPRVDAMDSAASRNRRLNAGLGQKVSGYQDLTAGDRASLDVDRARVGMSNQILADNKKTREIIEALPVYTAPADGAGGNSPVAVKPDGKEKKGRAGPKDRTADLLARHEQDMLSLRAQELQAQLQLATEAGERALINRDILDLERQAREAEIRHAVEQGDITATQGQAKLDLIKSIYGEAAKYDENGDIVASAKPSLYGLAIARDERLQAEQEAADLAEAETRAQSDALRDQYDLATTLDERRRIALAIIDLEDRARLEALRLIQLDEDIYDAKTRRLAAIEEARIIESRPAREEQVRRSNQGPLDRYIEDTRDTKTRVEEAMVRELQSVNDGITDALTKQLGIKNQFVKDMFSMFLEDVIFRPLAEALRNRQSGGGGGFLSSLLNIGATLLGSSSGAPPGTAGGMDLRGFGRASGGYVAPGQAVRVNEHKGTGVELLRMGANGGTVIPLGQVNARATQAPSQGAGVATVRLELSGDIDARIQEQSAGVAIEVVRASVPSIVDASVNETFRRGGRPSM